MINMITVDTLLGPLTVCETEGRITQVLFPGEAPPASAACLETKLLSEASRQLQEYFAGRRQIFALPLAPQGTDFQQRVWAALQRIPYGKTCSYKDIAIAVGNPPACRAVGQANHHNPIPIIIPCHRVIGTSGQLTGYGGGLPIKERLLDLEKGRYVK